MKYMEKIGHVIEQENKRRDIICLILFVLLSTVLRFLLTKFDRQMSIYPDELIHYNLSKSIFNGTGFTVHGNFFSFQNIAYCLFLSPFMMIKNSVLRLRIIVFVNGLLLSSSIFPVWRICKEFSLQKKYCLLSVLMVLLWPDLETNGLLMAENLYWPLVIWTIFFVIKFMKAEKIRYAILAGILSYLAFFCKEVGICLPLAVLGYFIVYPIIQRLFLGESLRNTYHKKNLLGMAAYLCIFAGAYILVNQFVFSGRINGYIHENSIGVNAILSTYNFMFMIYSLLYYFIAIILAFGIFPILYPIALYKYLDKLIQKVVIFSLIFLSGSALMIVYTITARKELGDVVVHVHFRYIAVFAAILIPLFFKIFQMIQNCEVDNKYQKRILVFLGIYGVVLFFLFKGPALGVSIEHSALRYYDALQTSIGPIATNKANSYIFYPYAVVLNLIIIFLMLKINLMIVNKKTVALFIVTLTIVNCINNYEVREKINTHTADPDMVLEMSNINDWFHKNGEIYKKILYIGNSDKFSKTRKIFDTYFDGTNVITMSTYMIDEHQRLANATFNVEDFIFKEIIWKRDYENITDVDYVIAEKGKLSGLTISNVDEIPDISADTYIVYRNQDSTKLTVTSPEPDFQIWFYGSDCNCYLYDIQGISEVEPDFTWTDGAIVSFDIPLAVDASSVRVCITVGNTCNGKQEYSIISGGKCIANSSINGSGKIEFSVSVTDGRVMFDMVLPNAISPKEIGEGQDPRRLSLQLLNVSFFEN